jgi:hydroxypyruvate isomerase
MFHEANDFVDRFRLAKKAGFHGVECGFPPLEVTLDQLVKVRQETGLKQVLLNISTGTVPNGQFGCASFPGEEEAFKANLQETLTYAKALDCKKY